MDKKFTRRYESYKRSLDSLAEARERDFTDSFVLSGTGAKFNITFELSWKVMKDILVQYYAMTNFVTGSPKEVLRMAFQAKLIEDGDWLQMLLIWNELLHDYDGDIIPGHCQAIVGKYLELFYQLEDTVEELLQKEETSL